MQPRPDGEGSERNITDVEHTEEEADSGGGHADQAAQSAGPGWLTRLSRALGSLAPAMPKMRRLRENSVAHDGAGESGEDGVADVGEGVQQVRGEAMLEGRDGEERGNSARSARSTNSRGMCARFLWGACARCGF